MPPSEGAGRLYPTPLFAYSLPFRLSQAVPKSSPSPVRVPLACSSATMIRHRSFRWTITVKLRRRRNVMIISRSCAVRSSIGALAVARAIGKGWASKKGLIAPSSDRAPAPSVFGSVLYTACLVPRRPSLGRCRPRNSPPGQVSVGGSFMLPRLFPGTINIDQCCIGQVGIAGDFTVQPQVLCNLSL